MENSLYSTTNTLSEAELASAFAIIAIFWGLIAIVTIISYVVAAISLMKIFTKAGVPSWIAWVPFYNNWKMLEIGGQRGFWAVLAIIPIVNIASAVFVYIAMYHIGLKLGKSGSFLVLGIFLPVVWMLWLAFDKSTWNEGASPAPSLHQPSTQNPTAV
jgi:hypothetical protein